jgi:hypothetical protein
VGALMLLFPAIQMSLDLNAIWKRLAWADVEPAPPAAETPGTRSAP